jgi:hypothetical protein
LWSSSGNWTPAGVPQPSASELVAIDRAGGGTVQFDYDYSGGGPLYAVVVKTASDGNTMTIDQTTSSGMMYSSYVDIGFNGKGRYSLSAGTLLVDTALILGDQPGSAGTLSISSNATAISEVAEPGLNGSGTILQSGSSFHQSSLMLIGAGTTATGYYGISSGSLNVLSDLRVGGVGQGTFDATGGTISAAQINIGGVGSGGSGSLLLSAAANIQCGNMTLGQRSNGVPIASDGFVRQ